MLSVSITSNIKPVRRNLRFTAGERSTVNFTAIASGINKQNFVYQWKKKNDDKFPERVSSVSGAELIIPTVLKSDEGKFYCIVTNEWGRSVQSRDITLKVEGNMVMSKDIC